MLPTLDARLTAAAELVRPGQPVADIGCDHGKLTAVLAASGKYPKVIGAEARAAMQQALKDIQTGEYAKKFILEGRTNYPSMTARRRLTAAHPIETVGEKLRDMMPWIKKNKLVDQSKN